MKYFEVKTRTLLDFLRKAEIIVTTALICQTVLLTYYFQIFSKHFILGSSSYK